MIFDNLLFICYNYIAIASAISEGGVTMSGRSFAKFGSRAVAAVVVVAMVWFMVNAFSLMGSSLAHGGYVPTWRDFSAEFGLRHNQSYPLVMGRTIAGASGNATAYARSGFFSAAAYASVDIQPDQALTMGFSHGDKSYIVALPFSKTTFVQKEGVDPTVKVKISNGQIDYNNTGSVNNVINSQTQIVCPAIVLCYNVYVPGQSQTAADTAAWPGVREKGLGSFLNKHLVAVEMTLSPELYAQLLGNMGDDKQPTDN
jgi:hypothetical protein